MITVGDAVVTVGDRGCTVITGNDTVGTISDTMTTVSHTMVTICNTMVMIDDTMVKIGNTVKLVYKDHATDQQNMVLNTEVVFICRFNNIESTPGDLWNVAFYKQVVFIYRWPLEQI